MIRCSKACIKVRPLKLASTVSTPELSYFQEGSSVAESIKRRWNAIIVEGYTITSNVPKEEKYRFFAEINIDNDRLWTVFKALIVNFPEEVALIYHHIDEEANYGEYVGKYELLNELEKYKR